MSATMTVSKEAKRTPVPMKGVVTPALLAKIKAVGVQPGTRQTMWRLIAALSRRRQLVGCT